MAAYRLPHQTIAEVDLLATALQRMSPGKVSQADAIAWAIARALAEVSETAGKPAPPPASPTAPMGRPPPVVAVPWTTPPPEGERHRVVVVAEGPTTVWGANDGARQGPSDARRGFPPD